MHEMQAVCGMGDAACVAIPFPFYLAPCLVGGLLSGFCCFGLVLCFLFPFLSPVSDHWVTMAVVGSSSSCVAIDCWHHLKNCILEVP